MADKEGCASGDCGASTVVLDELWGDNLRYKTVNACISLLLCLHSQQLLTVEDLKLGDNLHVVQQAMIDSHGSQGGFARLGL